MTVYSLLMKAFGSGLVGLLFDDEDEEEKKSADKSANYRVAILLSNASFQQGLAQQLLLNF
jgi:hypothetical protein